MPSNHYIDENISFKCLYQKSIKKYLYYWQNGWIIHWFFTVIATWGMPCVQISPVTNVDTRDGFSQSYRCLHIAKLNSLVMDYERNWYFHLFSEAFRSKFTYLEGSRSCFQCDNWLYALWNTVLYQISQLSLRIDSRLLSDFFIRVPCFSSWRKEVVYLMSSLAHSQRQTVLVHSSAEWVRKEKGRGQGTRK